MSRVHTIRFSKKKVTTSRYGLIPYLDLALFTFFTTSKKFSCISYILWKRYTSKIGTLSVAKCGDRDATRESERSDDVRVGVWVVVWW